MSYKVYLYLVQIGSTNLGSWKRTDYILEGLPETLCLGLNMP